MNVGQEKQMLLDFVLPLEKINNFIHSFNTRLKRQRNDLWINIFCYSYLILKKLFLKINNVFY